MTEREVKQLIKLLDKFKHTSEGGVMMNPRETGAISLIRQWVVWYGHDELCMDDLR